MTTKLQRQLSMGKLSSAVRDLLVYMPRKKPMLGVGLVVVAKCRELWEGLTRRPAAADDDDDYFKGSYESSCTATPINVLAAVKNGRPRRRRQRRLPPCVGGKQAREMLAAGSLVVTPRDGGRSPQAMAAGPDIDGLAEEFIKRFHEQLRMQVDDDDDDARPTSRLATYHVSAM